MTSYFHFFEMKTLFRSYLLLLMLSFAFTELSARRKPNISLIILKWRGLGDFQAKARRRHSEGSLSNQRAFGQLVDSKGRLSVFPHAILTIRYRSSDNPLMQRTKSNGLNMAFFLFMKEGRFGGLGLRNVRGLPMRHS